jgi:hypothetical protein
MTRRVLRSEVFEAGKHRPMILEIENGVACVRPKGCRTRIYINAAAVWQKGIKQMVDEQKKKSRRKR